MHDPQLFRPWAILMLLLVMSLGGCAYGGPESSHASAPEACIPSLMFPALDVLDLEAAEAFYVDMLGMEVTLRLGDEASERLEVTLDFVAEGAGCGAGLVLQHDRARSQGPVYDGLSRIAFRVADVRALVERIRAAGYEVLVEPYVIDVGGRRIELAFVRDPSGSRVELIQTP